MSKTNETITEEETDILSLISPRSFMEEMGIASNRS